jgi:hypothetical protein
MRGFEIVCRSMPALAACVALTIAAPGIGAQTDLDAFMREVVARRDDNWKKLQQYVLDERESIDVRGPGGAPIWGERRDYTWYIRDGFFVRSPVRVNGVEISDAERRASEADYLRRQQKREQRARAGAPPDAAESGVAADVDGILRQTRQPQFISSAYFLRFKFEEGRYALVGRETLDGREVLRVEYYPTKLFGGTDRRRNRNGASDGDRAYDAEFQRLMNKVALVTLWIDPPGHQIVKYTFDNVGFDFLPAQWLVHVDTVQATMRMGQPFPDVWLPRDLTVSLEMTLAIGQIDVRYGLDYHDYRRPDVATKVNVR